MNKSIKKKIIVISSVSIVVAVLLFTINFQPFQTSKDSYSSYLKTAIDKSVKLTRTYQDEIALWQRGNYSNATMAKITETYLPQFTKQLEDFNDTTASEKYGEVKDNFVKSFSNEIKSYELFRDYLITNNSTANELSNDYLSEALNYETIARNAFTAAVNNNTR
jgi:uncharacterized membrane protein YvbJ